MLDRIDRILELHKRRKDLYNELYDLEMTNEKFDMYRISIVIMEMQDIDKDLQKLGATVNEFGEIVICGRH